MRCLVMISTLVLLLGCVESKNAQWCDRLNGTGFPPLAYFADGHLKAVSQVTGVNGQPTWTTDLQTFIDGFDNSQVIYVEYSTKDNFFVAHSWREYASHHLWINATLTLREIPNHPFIDPRLMTYSPDWLQYVDGGHAKVLVYDQYKEFPTLHSKKYDGLWFMQVFVVDRESKFVLFGDGTSGGYWNPRIFHYPHVLGSERS